MTNTRQQSSTFTLTAQAGRWTAAALHGLPKATTLQFKLTMNAQGTVWLLDAQNYSGFPHPQAVLHRGVAGPQYASSVTVPESGDYYLILDNRSGSETVRADVEVTACVDEAAVLGPPQDGLDAANEMLARVAKELSSFFTFDSLQIRTEAGGQAAITREPGGIRINMDFSLAVIDFVQDKQKVWMMLFVVLFQELARLLLERTPNHGDGDHAEATDELGTAMMVMFGYEAHVRGQAQYVATDPHGQRLAKELAAFDRLPLTPQRAQAMLRWLDEPDLVTRWQQVLLPNMHTTILQQLLHQPQPWTTVALVEQELAKR